MHYMREEVCPNVFEWLQAAATLDSNAPSKSRDSACAAQPRKYHHARPLLRRPSAKGARHPGQACRTTRLRKVSRHGARSSLANSAALAAVS